MQIFSWIGNVFGYLLWFFYEFTKNYGVSIILFTIVLKIIMFPFSIKQQKSMAKNTRLQGKQKEIQKKYGDNKQKMSEEMQKLYQQEGVNPMGGCLTSIIPLIIRCRIPCTSPEARSRRRCSCSSRCPAWEICSAAFTEKSIW